MMLRVWYLPLPLLAACTEGTPLSELPSLELAIGASPFLVDVEIRYRHEANEPCATLAGDFEATVNGKAMPITERGAAKQGGCTWPALRLDHPAAAVRTTLVLRDPSLTITASLADALAPRSAQLVPDGPWTFTPGQIVTLQWSQVSDFATHTPFPAFVYDDPSRGTIFAGAVATVAGDRITFHTPNVAISGATLQVTLFSNAPGGIDPLLTCTGASCTFARGPEFAHLIDVQ